MADIHIDMVGPDQRLALAAAQRAEASADEAQAAALLAQSFETEFTASAGQTNFILPFPALSRVAVYVNGVRLSSGEYTVTGNLLQLTTPSAAGDIVTVLIGEGYSVPAPIIMAAGLFADIFSAVIPAGTTRIWTSGHTWDGIGAAFYRYDPLVDAAYVAAHPLTSALDATGRGFRLDMFDMSPEHAGGRAIPLGSPITGTYAAANVAALNELKALQNEDTTLRVISLGNGIYEINAAITFAYDGVHFVGAGLGRSVLKNINPYTVGVANGACVYLGNCDGVVIADMTLFAQSDYGTIASFHSDTSRVRLRNLYITCETYANNTGTTGTNGIKLVLDNSPTGAHDWAIDDCIFETGRMGIEIQAHPAVYTTYKYTHIRMRNCQFIRCGTQNQLGGFTAWQAESYSGFGYDVLCQDAYYDGCIGILVENVGCSLLVRERDKIRADTYVSATSIYLSYSNYHQMLDCVVRGTRLVKDRGELLTSQGDQHFGRVKAALGRSSVTNVVRFLLEDVVLDSTTANYMFSFSMDGVNQATYPDINASEITIRNCDLKGVNPPIEIRNLGGVHKVYGNRLRSEHSSGVLGHFGSNVTANTDAAGYAVGVDTVLMDATSSGAIMSGARISFANDPARSYTVVQRYPLSAGAPVKFWPALKTAIPAAVTAITVRNSTLDLRGGNEWTCPNFAGYATAIPVNATGNANVVRAAHNNQGDCVTRLKLTGTIASGATSVTLFHQFSAVPGSATAVPTGAWGADSRALSVDYTSTSSVTVSVATATTAARTVECVVERPEVW